ncbi:MAG: nicotinamide-nucleotide amidohydrolase family protein [Thermovirgaceae bacterium]|nr:nicotinamide-nucleotide amidohydrolase family protein [Thermovirgaceae bacterium]
MVNNNVSDRINNVCGVDVDERHPENIKEAVIIDAARRKLTICAAESCTGGLLGGALTETPGSSSVFLGSAVCYSNEAKSRVLGVDPDLISASGAVSGGCATAMAEGARRLFGADIACAVTGIAGPGGGTDEKPVGLVWFAIETPWEKAVFFRIFSGGRTEIRKRAVYTALETLRGSIGRKIP